MSLLLLAGFGTATLSVVFVLICVLLIFMVVITPSSEGGMAAAFGGMGSETFFGTKAHQSISKVTLFLAVSFLVLAIVLNKIHSSDTAPSPDGTPKKSEREKDIEKLPGAPSNLPSAPSTPSNP